jgi:heptosyltransferase-2
LINRSGAWKAMSRCLRAGDVICLFSDQNAGDAGIWTPFFGRLASCSPLTSTVAARTGAAIVPLAVRTLPDGRYQMEFFPALEPARGREVGAVEAELNGWFEAQIRRTPADWLWLHDRWKTPDPRFLLRRDTRAVHVPAGSELQPFRILVRGMNWLGDALMHLGALRDLKAGRPDARLAVVTPPKLAGLYRLCPFVDEVIEQPASRSLLGTARRIRAWNPDVAVLLPNSWRVVLEAWLGGVTGRVGYRINGRGRRALPRKIPVDLRATGMEHQRLTWQRAIPYVGGEPAAEPVRLRPPVDPARGGYGVIAPGAEFGPAKRWPAERYAAAARLVGDAIPRWIIVGAPGDRAACEAVARELPGADNQCGATSLEQLASLLAGAAVVLCNDSGVMHLAAACGAPTVAVFGSTEPRLTRPVNEGVVVVRKHVACSPCFRRECPLKHLKCLTRITPEDVARAVASARGATPAQPLPGLAAGC